MHGAKATRPRGHLGPWFPSIIRFHSILLLFSLFPTVPASSAEEAPLLVAMGKELARSFEKLKDKGASPFFFLAYRATEETEVDLTASYGASTDRSASSMRVADIELRVGDRHLDNTHELREDWDWGGLQSSTRLPLEDDEAAIRAALWLATDESFKSAQERLTKVKTNKAVKVEEDDPSDDFSVEEPRVHIESPVDSKFDEEAWNGRLKRCSARFKIYPYVLGSQVSLRVGATNRYFVSSDGAKIQFGKTSCRLGIQGEAKASDGMELYLYESFDAPTTDGLPGEEKILKTVDDIAVRLKALREAPLVEPYAGPAIICNRACAVFFHEIFGHRVEGHRQKSVDEGQTFTKKLNQRIMPGSISVFDDPTRQRFKEIYLNGHYSFDDEGVPAQRVPLVENGILRGFLMSRSPIRGFQKSNGHGRCQPGESVVARQGNLIVDSTSRVSFAELRQMLVAEAKRQAKPYGLMFQDISGGYTITGRYGPQAFKVIPLYVVRVFADGRPDEVVRGVDIVGTPIASLEKILAAGDDDDVFNGYCGAESGSVPVSAIAPSILVSEIEVEKKEKSQERLPILPPPLYDPEGKREKGSAFAEGGQR